MAVEQAQGTGAFFRELRKNRNAFSMLLCEPLWGIPYNLLMPYFSLYMKGMGCSPEQIGLINTAGMACQVLFALLAAPVTDRLGRKRTTLIFDTIGWSGSMLIWLFSRNFYFFLAAAAVQAIYKVAGVSWTCLLVEDTDKSLLVKLFSWTTIAGLLAGLFSPIAAALVKNFRFLPTIRWLILLNFVMMTSMFLIRNHFSHETAVGRMRMEQSRNEPFFGQISALLKVTGDIWHRKRTLLFFTLSIVYNVALAVKAPFFALLLTGTLRFSDYYAGVFATVSSLVMLAMYLFAQPLLRHLLPRAPLSVGLAICAAGSLALVPSFGSRGANLATVIVSVVLTAVGTSVAQPYIDGLCHASMDNDKRSNMTSILNILLMGVSAPFGLIGGLLYTADSRIPFLAASLLFVVCAALMVFLYKSESMEKNQAAAS